MPHGFTVVLVLTCRIATVIAGVFAFYLAMFQYEDDEGRWQNRIEELWVSIHDRARYTDTTATAYFNKVTEFVTWGLDRLYGNKVVSFRMIGVSTSLSFGGFVLACNFILGDLPIWFVMLSPLFWIMAFIPFFFHRWKLATPFTLLPLCSFQLAFLVGMLVVDKSWQTSFNDLAFSLGVLVMSLCSDLVVLILVRKLLSYISGTTKLGRVLVATAGLVAVALGLSLGVFTLGYLHYPKVEFVLIATGLLNISTSLTCCFPLLALVLVILHRIFWPLTSRIIYPLARFKVLSNRKLLVAFGISCFLFGFGLDHIGFSLVERVLRAA